MSDHTIDVGPVWCPSCKREFGSTERDAEVSALRAALEAAETDAQLCRERLGDERERRRVAEARAVPDGFVMLDGRRWSVEVWAAWTIANNFAEHPDAQPARLVPADTEKPYDIDDYDEMTMGSAGE